MSDVPYDYHAIHDRRLEGWSWKEIAADYDRAPSTVRKWFQKECDARQTPGRYVAGPDEATEEKILTRDEVERITTLDDLVEFFKVDTDRWMVRDFRINKWEQHSVEKGVVPLYQVRANLVRNLSREAEIAREAYQQVVEDMRAHSPDPAGPEPSLLSYGEDVLYVLGLMDPHLGMLAWGAEVGEDYDLNLALRDYRNAVEHLLGTTKFYNVRRVLMVVGNDTLHIDALQDGKVGATTSGTPQDFDSRLPKLFTEARRAIVDAVDRARQIAPVDVMVVQGNHDEHSMYKLGEVLNAWYREDEHVQVLNQPSLRKYYTYGQNLLGFTHGQEFKRKREPLALIMMDEAARAGIDVRQHKVREWLTGHFHAAAELEHMAPRQNLTETRGIRIRSLPGLTASDAWHTREGYFHQRAATGLAYRSTGGLAGLHEFHP